ncbi:MAG: carbon storage regulator CsrA [Proteobacteria bacterium]|nr:carbon storage regulator CsrA [Pseudomonadota bacterium]
MLILSRKMGEVIKIGDEITLHVIDISKGFVKLGIDAPENITILREEVYERVRDANIESAKGGISGLFMAADILKKKVKKE